MTADGWTRAVRQQLGLGRLLPLGGPSDGAWIAESAVQGVLRRAVDGLPGVRLGSLRIEAADPAGHYEPAAPAPPSALPPGPLRIVAAFAAVSWDPIPGAAERLREELLVAAGAIGLRATEADLRVTELLDDLPTTGLAAATPPTEAAAGAQDLTDRTAARHERREDEPAQVAAVVQEVPGVAALTGVLGGRGRAVHIEPRSEEKNTEDDKDDKNNKSYTDDEDSDTPPRRHVRVEISVARDRQPLEVAGAVRTAVANALPDRPTASVLVTAVV